MKKLLCFMVLAALVVSMQAQEAYGDAPQRDLKLMVRNSKGKVMQDFPVLAVIKGDTSMQSLDRFGNRYFKVAETDTLALVVDNTIYEFPVAGYDSLYIAFKNRKKIAGVARKEGLIDIGYGTVLRESNTGAVGYLDMKGASNYSDLRSYMRGRVAGVQFMANGTLLIRGINSINSGIEALVIVDGVPMASFNDANSMLSPNDVASISVLKDASSSGIYGVRGANGVVIIKTKTGAN